MSVGSSTSRSLAVIDPVVQELEREMARLSSSFQRDESFLIQELGNLHFTLGQLYTCPAQQRPRILLSAHELLRQPSHGVSCFSLTVRSLERRIGEVKEACDIQKQRMEKERERARLKEWWLKIIHCPHEEEARLSDEICLRLHISLKGARATKEKILRVITYRIQRLTAEDLHETWRQCDLLHSFSILKLPQEIQGLVTEHCDEGTHKLLMRTCRSLRHVTLWQKSLQVKSALEETLQSLIECISKFSSGRVDESLRFHRLKVVESLSMIQSCVRRSLDPTTLRSLHQSVLTIRESVLQTLSVLPFDDIDSLCLEGKKFLRLRRIFSVAYLLPRAEKCPSVQMDSAFTTSIVRLFEGRGICSRRELTPSCARLQKEKRDLSAKSLFSCRRWTCGGGLSNRAGLSRNYS